MSDSYLDIINMKYEKSKKYNHMSLYDRSAQFAPFAALAGFEDAVSETARLTDDKKELDDGLKAILNYKLEIIKNLLDTKPIITFVYFKKDKRKNGGSYVETNGIIKKIDDIEGKIILTSYEEIFLDDIIDIKGECIKDI